LTSRRAPANRGYNRGMRMGAMRADRCCALARALAAGLLGAAGCASSSQPAPQIGALSPSQAYNDVPHRLAIQGGPFRPAFRFDTGSGEASIDVGAFAAWLVPSTALPFSTPNLPAGADAAVPPSSLIRASAVAWQSPQVLLAEWPAGLAAGFYDLHVQDPRGQTGVLANAFTSLGPDRAAPTVAMESPVADGVVAMGSSVTVTLRASDGDGWLASLRWSISSASATVAAASCNVPASSHQTACTFRFTAPTTSTTLDALFVDAQVADSVGLTGTLHEVLLLAQPPTVTSLYPTIMPSIQMPSTQPPVLTVEGTNFIPSDNGVPGTQLVVDGQPLTTVALESSTKISALVGNLDPGIVTVTVRTGGAEVYAGELELVGLPVVRAVSPTDGPSSGGNRIAVVGNHFRRRSTQLYFAGSGGTGAVALGCPTFVSENRIDGIMPPGTGRVSVVAFDPVGGQTSLPDAYGYDDLAPLGGDGGPPLTTDGGVACPDGGP
jgi:hypothetical protein